MAKKFKIKDSSRKPIINLVQLHFFSDLMYLSGNPNYFEDRIMVWDGNIEKGSFLFDNRSGDVLAISWDENFLVAGIFDHESKRNDINSAFESNEVWPLNEKNQKPADDPTYFFPNFPDKYLPLLRSCEKLIKQQNGDSNITSAMWCDDSVCFIPESSKKANENGLWMLDNYLVSVEKALIDPEAKRPEPIKDFYLSELVGDIQAPINSRAWRHQYHFSDEQVTLAEQVVNALAQDSEIRLSSKDLETFLGGRSDQSVDQKNLSFIKEELKKISVVIDI